MTKKTSVFVWKKQYDWMLEYNRQNLSAEFPFLNQKATIIPVLNQKAQKVFTACCFGHLEIMAYEQKQRSYIAEDYRRHPWRTLPMNAFLKKKEKKQFHKQAENIAHMTRQIFDKWVMLQVQNIAKGARSHLHNRHDLRNY